MKKARFAFFALLLSLSLFAATSALADDTACTVTFSPYAGGILFEGDAHLKTSGLYGFGLGYNFTNNWGAEFVFGGSNSGFRSSAKAADNLNSDNDLRTNMTMYEFNVMYRFNTIWGLRPYVEAGGGWMRFSNVGPGLLQDHHTHGLGDYGGGLEYFIMPDKIALRADVQHIITANPGLNDLKITGGLTFFIGGCPKVAPPPPPPPPPPAPVVQAPPPPPPPAPKKQEAVCITLKILFDFDKDDVKPEYNDDIKQVADFLKANPTFHGTIEGGTDAVGSDEYNMKLSIRRAESVKKVLVDTFGIAADRLTTVGYGKHAPVDTNLTAEGREQNRRAVRVYCSSGEDVPPPAKPRKCIVLKVDFAVGSADVDPEKYADTFKEVADYMKAHPDFIGTVEGYCDASGTSKVNMDLSMKRAENVKKILVEKYGVPADHLRAEGYGKERPVADNETPEGRAVNRYAVQVVCEPE